jgi:hypothetical protein
MNSLMLREGYVSDCAFAARGSASAATMAQQAARMIRRIIQAFGPNSALQSIRSGS